jgi:acyl carrier protein
MARIPYPASTSPTGVTHRIQEESTTWPAPSRDPQGLAEIVNEIAGIPADIQTEKSFTDDLDIDSLSMVEVVVAAEEKFGVQIPDDEVKNLKTVGDAVAYIERSVA